MTEVKKNLAHASQRIAILFIIALLVSCGENRFHLEAQNFTLETLDGKGNLSLQDYRGEVVYLTFWASWCEPCKKEMPFLATLWQEHRHRGFQVIGINVDDDIAAAREFAAKHELPFPLVYDQDRLISKRYRIPGYPAHYVLDRSGRIRFTAVGFNRDDTVAVSQEVETLLQESAGVAN